MTANHPSFISARNRRHPENILPKLPLLISVPHGGYALPLDLLPSIALDFHDIFPDSDPCTRQIFSFGEEVLYYHDTDIARAVIDLNRAYDDLPPHNPDGVIKSHTILQAPVYQQGRQPDSQKIQQLLNNYYYPYHRRLADYSKDSSLLCGFDCHSMLEFLPTVEPIASNERPFICLSNCGDENGEAEDLELSCPTEFILLFADCLRSEFPEEKDNILLNTPFKGGHIVRHHSRQIPWIQIELNRRAYLRSPWHDPDTLLVDYSRIEYLRRKFLRAFITFSKEVSTMQSIQVPTYSLSRSAVSPAISFNP